MQESTTSLWFSPDYVKDLGPQRKPAIQLPPGNPMTRVAQSIEQQPITFTPLAKDLKILIWSNSDAGAMHIHAELGKIGYTNVWTATSYTEGLSKIETNLFDFFIIDLSLDGVGTRIVKALRASNTYKNTPMLICTESQLIQDMLNAMKAGANDLICKPINANLLQKKLALHSKMTIAS